MGIWTRGSALAARALRRIGGAAGIGGIGMGGGADTGRNDRPPRHFVEDYRRLVREALALPPREDALSLAVGGDYERIGGIERAILLHHGLEAGSRLVDLGCGSGRLSSALTAHGPDIAYVGIDIVPELLAYARARAKPAFLFLCHTDLDLPLPTAGADMVCAFSVFTHLKQTETYLYLADIHRALRPGGRLVLSFLEFDQPANWPVFEASARAERLGVSSPLNIFAERAQWSTFARRLGFRVRAFHGPMDHPWGREALGQSVAVLERA